MNTILNADFQDQTILIVNGKSTDLDVAVQTLEKLGLRLVIAQDGEECLQQARLIRPELILLAVKMPGTDGFETCRRLKSSKETRDIPIIFIPASAETDDRIAGFSAGGIDYLAKPIESAEVSARVKTQLTLRLTQKRLAEQNERLRQKVTLPKQAGLVTDHTHDDLEEKVKRRTAELAQANASLKAEINERIWAQQALKKSAEEIFDLYNNAPCGYHSVDKDGTFVQINDTELRWLGFTREEMIGKRKFSAFLTPDSLKNYEEAFARLKEQGTVHNLEFQIFKRNGAVMSVLVNGSILKDAAGNFVMSRSTVYDITERKQQEERIHHMAHHDMLTGLPNRTLLRDRINQAIAQAHRNQKMVAVLFIDLDFFKNINDSLGHQIGDQLLQKATSRLQRCLREGDSVARLGGDEFVISLPGINKRPRCCGCCAENIGCTGYPFPRG